MAALTENISWSEIQAWCTCRQKWYWGYGRKIVTKKIQEAPSVGSCGHAAIAAYRRGKDWKEAVDNWLSSEIERRGEMFDEEIEAFQDMAELIRNIMPRYIEQYQVEDANFTTVKVEERFEVPVAGTKIKLIGYWDELLMDRDGFYWLRENKFPRQRFRSEEDLELDGQVGTYQWAANRLGYQIVGTIFDQILAKLPAIPKTNKDGSLSRAKVATDWTTYEKTVRENGLDPVDYMEMQDKLADLKFFDRKYIYRPPVEVKLFAQDMRRRIWDVRKTKKHIYRNESAINCGWCSYRELCLELVKGGDIEEIIEMQYEPKLSREEVELLNDRQNAS